MPRWSAVVVLVLVAGTVAGCAGGSDVPRTVTLADLVADHDRYHDQLVVTEGVVRSYDDPLHYWIEDAEPNRVELFPHEVVEDLVGLRIAVQGRFTFEEGRGRGIEIADVEVVGDVPQALDRRAGGPGRPGAGGHVRRHRSHRIMTQGLHPEEAADGSVDA